VRLGQAGAILEPGVAYVAPHGSHMRIDGRKVRRIRLDEGPAVHGVRPAADPLFESIAAHCGPRSVGVVLTGMGSDGAAGVRAIAEAGGCTIAQDEETSVVWGMPGAAVRVGGVTRVLPINLMAAEIDRAVREVSRR
jgi:two-component system chemotaxis response regulator CheB